MKLWTYQQTSSNGHGCTSNGKCSRLFSSRHPPAFTLLPRCRLTKICLGTFVETSVTRGVVVEWKVRVDTFGKLHANFAESEFDLLGREVAPNAITHYTKKTFHIVRRTSSGVLGFPCVILTSPPLTALNIGNNSNERLLGETQNIFDTPVEHTHRTERKQTNSTYTYHATRKSNRYLHVNVHIICIWESYLLTSRRLKS